MFLVIDTETTGLDHWHSAEAFAIGILVCPEGGEVESHYWEWPVNPFTRKVTTNPTDVKRIQELCSLECPKWFHNSKFDLYMLAKLGIKVSGKIEDTLFASMICNSQEDRYGLKPLAWKYFGIGDNELTTLKKAIDKIRRLAKKRGLKWALHEETEADYWMLQHAKSVGLHFEENYVKTYCELDLVRTHLLKGMYEEKMAEEPLFRQTYEFELSLQPLTVKIETRGMCISKERTLQGMAYCDEQAEGHLVNLRKMTKDPEFNPGSPQQLAKALYSKEGQNLKCLKRTPTGTESTDWMALRPYGQHPFVREVLAYRGAEKGSSMFFRPYLELMLPDHITPGADIFCLHPGLNQMGARRTGRWSSSQPNLQQVSNPETSRGTDPSNARMAFGPRPGYAWYCPDYSQMEPRVFADVGQIDSMLAAIYAGRDLNTENTNKAWGGKGNPRAIEAAVRILELGQDRASNPSVQATWDRLDWHIGKHREVSQDVQMSLAQDWLAEFDYDIVKAEASLDKTTLRSRAKAMIFLKTYGGGADAAMDLLYCTKAEAERCIQEFFSPFPEIDAYMQELTKRSRRDGYIITRYGRKLMVPHYEAYKCVNYMVQGTCADLMKHAMKRCDEFLTRTGLDAHVQMTVHDEIIFEIRHEHAFKWLLRHICYLMSDHEGRLRVPMPVEIKKVKTQWDIKEKIKL